MKTMLIPTSVITTLTDYLKIEYFYLNEKQQQKLIKQLVNLWLFVYNTQQEDTKCESLSYYTNILYQDLEPFKLIINGTKFYYSDLIQILELTNLLNKNNIFTIGEYSKSYRINVNIILNSKNYTEFQIDFSKIYKNTKNKQYWLDIYPQFENLINDIYNTTINLDEYMYYLVNNKGLELKSKLKNGKLKRRYIDNEYIYHCYNAALKLNLKNIWVKLSDQGRLYSTIASLPTTSVPYILLYNEKTAEIDISNSQPLLLTHLLDNSKHKQYKQDVENGIFYDKMANIMGISRGEFKVLSYKHIFFSKKQLTTGIFYNKMNEIYPNLVDDINIIKNDVILAHKLQELESNIFVKKIGSIQIHKLLRHDSVIVTTNNTNLIEKYIEIEYKKLNIKATIKIN